MRARVVEAYSTTSADGLPLVLGSEVEVLACDQPAWWLGRDENGRSGLFPSARVRLIGSPMLPTKSDGRIVTALYAFEATGPDEVSFAAGDRIEVVARSKSGWWKGRVVRSSGAPAPVGLFPANRTTAGEDDKRAAKSPPEGGSDPPGPVVATAAPEGPSTVAAAEAEAARDSGGKRSPPPVRLASSPRRLAELFKFNKKASDDGSAPAPVAAEDNASVKATTATTTSSPGSHSNPQTPLSPRRVAANLMASLSKFKGSKKEELDIAHPFEQVALAEEEEEKDHFGLLSSDAPAKEARQPPPRPQPVDAAEAMRRRHGFILAELVNTESDYVRDLEAIVEVFLLPLRVNGIVTKEEADNVFLNLPHLIPLNRALLEKLREQAGLPVEQQRVGAVFQAFFGADSIREYTAYASRSQLSGRTLLSLAKNAQWTRFLEEAYRDPKLRDLKLDTFLVQPVQRMCRYPLLLGELQRATPATCVDSVDLTASLATVAHMIAEMNETRRENENLRHAVELQSSLKHLPADLNLAANGRVLEREAGLFLLDPRAKRSPARGARPVPVRVWMFNDVLVWGCVQKFFATSSVVFRGAAYFNAALVNDLADAPDAENAFEVICFPSKETAVFCCASAAQKAEWFAALGAAVDQCLKEAASKVRAATAAAAAAASVAPAAALVAIPGGGGGSLTRNTNKVSFTKGSVRVKGELSQRIVKLRDEMAHPSTGVEQVERNGERIFTGRSALDWTKIRFDLTTEREQQGIELMNGLLRVGFVVAMFDTSVENGFEPGFTSFYQFS